MSLTFVLIAITCLVSLMAFGNLALIQRLILWPPAITRGKEWWRLVTCGFIHADGTHLLFNMVTLYFFGPPIERVLAASIGEVGYVLFYIAALAVSALPSYLEHKNDADYRSLGASGAVSAVLFAFILIQPWTTIYVFMIPVPAIVYAVLYVVYSIYVGKKGGDNINHSAHLWGAAFGVAFLAVTDPSLLGQFFERLGHPSYRI